MQLYSAAGPQFALDVLENRIAGKLETAFVGRFGHRPGQGEIRSWQNSLRAMSQVLQAAHAPDAGIILEYQLPQSSRRLDVLVSGYNQAGDPNAVVVELKQWDRVEPSAISECVTTFVGGRHRDVLHPSVQVSRYVQYLADFRPVFSDGAIGLNGCAYLHNMQQDEARVLLGSAFLSDRERSPIYLGDQSRLLADYLRPQVGFGDGLEPLKQIEASPYRASKRLLEHTAKMVAGQTEFVLIDDQRVAFNAVVDAVREAYHRTTKVVFVIQGGPGTGKSVIALQLLGALSAAGYNTLHATGSKAFTENLRRIVRSRAGEQFKYFNSFGDAAANGIDVLVLDEAHRIRESSQDRYRPQRWSGKPQIDELLAAAKVAVFFIDELQVVRPGEVGSVPLIIGAAAGHDAELMELELETQFRCGGSDGFIAWIENTLGIRETANVFWEDDPNFDLRLVDSVEELERLIRQRAAEESTARLSAGFCWPWSSPCPDGTLVSDVQVGSWSKPWNAKSSAGRLARGIPKENFWASDPAGIEQVGCVYTAQGFEYDYAGVIWGRDLRYDPELQDWRGFPQESADNVVKRAKDGFLPLVKNTYRVLLTRGLKGCYIYCIDPETKAFLLSRMDNES